MVSSWEQKKGILQGMEKMLSRGAKKIIGTGLPLLYFFQDEKKANGWLLAICHNQFQIGLLMTFFHPLSLILFIFLSSVKMPVSSKELLL